MTNLFHNARENRLRAFWRLLLQSVLDTIGAALLGSLAFVAFALFGGATLGAGALDSLAASPALGTIIGGMSLVAALFSVWLAGRFFDRRPFSGFGLNLDRGWWLDFGFGLLLGAFLMTGIFLIELAAGWVEVVGTLEAISGRSFFPAILAPVVFFLCVGFYEELVSRGYRLQNMAEGLNFPGLGSKGAVVLAWVLSSSLFGLLHLPNPGATAVSTINITFAGLLLGTGYVLTGRLAIPIGLHVTWNFFQGNVFGFPVSGIEPIGATFISIEQGGPPLFTGGAFGPEAGLLDIAATVIGSLLIWLWVRVRSGEATIQESIAEPPVGKAEEPRASGENPKS